MKNLVIKKHHLHDGVFNRHGGTPRVRSMLRSKALD
jgi:hypothetical protein